MSLHRRGLHRLKVDNLDRVAVSRAQLQKRRDREENNADFEHHPGRLPMQAFPDVVAGDSANQDGAGDPGGQNGVQKAGNGGRVENGGAKVRQNDFTGGGDFISGGRLHPGVGHQNPEGRQMAADKHEQSGSPVNAGRCFFSAENQHADKNRLQEKSDDAFGGKERSENVAHRS